MNAVQGLNRVEFLIRPRDLLRGRVSVREDRCERRRSRRRRIRGRRSRRGGRRRRRDADRSLVRRRLAIDELRDALMEMRRRRLPCVAKAVHLSVRPTLQADEGGAHLCGHRTARQPHVRDDERPLAVLERRETVVPEEPVPFGAAARRTRRRRTMNRLYVLRDGGVERLDRAHERGPSVHEVERARYRGHPCSTIP